MTYKQLLSLHNLDFQMNRVLTHGEEACREEGLLEIAPKLQEFDPIPVLSSARCWHEELKVMDG